MAKLKIGVIGHVEHITLGRVDSVPTAGEITHLNSVVWFPGGGGGMTFAQLCKSDAEVHLFTAIGQDEAGTAVADELQKANAHIHVAKRSAPHTRDVVMVDPHGERTIVVLGQPLHPTAQDSLPWHLLSTFDAAYFTARDPQLLEYARGATQLVVTARRREAIWAARVQPDVIVGSLLDPKERSSRAQYELPPAALVMTEGAKGGIVETEAGTSRFVAPENVSTHGGAYGAGDSFAGALVYYVASGFSVFEAAQRSGLYGAAVYSELHSVNAQQVLSAE